MRVMVFFDLPVVEKQDRQMYTKFRAFLIRDGYEMVQYSVYSRICANKDAGDKHVIRLKKNMPKRGAIRVLMLTEKQYSDMLVIYGGVENKDNKITVNKLLIF